MRTSQGDPRGRPGSCARSVKLRGTMLTKSGVMLSEAKHAFQATAWGGPDRDPSLRSG